MVVAQHDLEPVSELVMLVLPAILSLNRFRWSRQRGATPGSYQRGSLASGKLDV
jgi:hypothetical protein